MSFPTTPLFPSAPTWPGTYSFPGSPTFPDLSNLHPECSVIGGMSGSTPQFNAPTLSKWVRAKVTLTNSQGSVVGWSNAIGPILAAPPAIFSDTFTGTNGVNLPAHTPDIAPAGSWTVDAGDWEIQSNQAYANATDSNGFFDVGQSDGTLEMQASLPGDGTFIVIFRQVASNSLWYFIITRATGSASALLHKYVGGSLTVVGSASATFPAATMNAVKIVMSGSSITCYINGASIFAVSDSDNSTGTKHGMYSSVVGSVVDSITFVQP